MDELPYHGHALDKVAAFKREVNILMGEALLQSEPPQPQVGVRGRQRPRATQMIQACPTDHNHYGSNGSCYKHHSTPSWAYLSSLSSPHTLAGFA
jgi:hypothetical protein